MTRLANLRPVIQSLLIMIAVHHMWRHGDRYVSNFLCAIKTDLFLVSLNPTLFVVIPRWHIPLTRL